LGALGAPLGSCQAKGLTNKSPSDFNCKLKKQGVSPTVKSFPLNSRATPYLVRGPQNLLVAPVKTDTIILVTIRIFSRQPLKEIGKRIAWP